MVGTGKTVLSIALTSFIQTLKTELFNHITNIDDLDREKSLLFQVNEGEEPDNKEHERKILKEVLSKV